MPSFRVNSRWAKLAKVTDHLFIGGLVAVNPKQIAENKITCIINATSEVPNLRMAGVANLKLWLDDTLNTDLRPYFDMVADQIQMIQDQDGRTLVHCLAGVSRSASFCLAYLMKYEQKSLREAFQHLSARRPVVRPNLAFWRQLVDYELELYGRSTVQFVRVGGQELPDVYVVECEEPGSSNESSSEFDSISIASSRSLSEDSNEGLDLISEEEEPNVDADLTVDTNTASLAAPVSVY